MNHNAINVALYFLKFRPRTVFEIEQKLKSKRYDDKEIAATVAVLKRNKLLDDENFAKMWVRDRNHLKPTGSYLLKLELKKLGVNDNIIEKSLVNQDEEDLARRAIESKNRYCHADFPKKAAFLQRRGFKTSIIYKVLKEI